MLRTITFLLGLIISPLASAQSTEPPRTVASASEPSLVEKMTSGARNASRDGRCEAISMIGKRVRELDARYHDEVYAVDPVITACVPGRRMPERVLQFSVPPDTSASGDGSRTDVQRPLPRARYKSPGTALALSFGVTGAGLLTMIVAAHTESTETLATFAASGAFMIALGPTTGHIYANNTWNDGLKWRLASLGLAVGTTTAALAVCPPFSRGCNEPVAGLLGIVSLGAVISYIGATFYEMGTAGVSARRHNDTHELELAVAPIVGREPGIALVGRF